MKFKLRKHLKTAVSVLVMIITMALFAMWNINTHAEAGEVTETDSICAEAPVLPEIHEVISDYDSLLSFELKNTATVGAAVAIVYKNEIVYLKCFGVRKTGGKDSVNENTLFRLASVSKTISGVLAGLMIADSTLLLDHKVVEYLPGLKFSDNALNQQLTLRNILSHATGLPPHTYDDLVEQKVPQRLIIEQLPQVGMASPPGELYAYQNVMFSLFDTIVSAKTGKNYGSALKEKIFTPFEMNEASVGFQAFANNPNKALPHSWSRNNFKLIPLNDRYYNTLAAAGINASISDMAHFMQHVLSDTVPQLIKASEIIFTPQIYTSLSAGYFSQWENVGSKSYGIGWRIIDYKGRKVAYHGGFVKGYRAEIALCKDENVGIVYLSNAPSIAAARSIPLFLNRLFEFKEQQKLVDEPDKKEVPQRKS